jgi:beta-phosphoglucomutase-like phosphatase (HAD superfamily)
VVDIGAGGGRSQWFSKKKTAHEKWDDSVARNLRLANPAWQKAFGHSVHDVGEARSRIGKNGEKLLSAFRSEDQIRDHGEALEARRGNHCKAHCLPLLRPSPAVPESLQRLSGQRTTLAVGSSAQQEELEVYLDVARVAKRFDVTASSEDAKSFQARSRHDDSR